ncbi:MAG TPA: class I SAM-dependent methyltransferase [Gammaproteobacteria bacterium]|nr:class I SAM-dependent methyltransferase [Gammaproteobacteria bacterium]
MMLSNKQITKESYEATADEFAHNVSHLAPMESIKEFISLLPSNPEILDLGCGSGRDAKIFSEMGANVLGIDFCSNMINIARRHAPLARFEIMDIEEMNLPESHYDGIWSTCSLGHIAKNEFQNVMDTVYSLLKNGGYFYLALKKGQGESLEQDRRYDGNHKKFWSYFEEDEIKQFLTMSNFDIIDFSVVEKNSSYQTHSAFRIYCRKMIY